MVTKAGKAKRRERRRILRIWVGFWVIAALLLAIGVFVIIMRLHSG